MVTGMEENRILICEDSIEGIFTGIYEAYARRCVPEHTMLQIGETTEYQLFAACEEIAPDDSKTEKVIKTIVEKFGEEVYLTFCKAIASTQEEKGDAVYHTLANGLRMKNKRRVMEDFSRPFVNRVFELCRNTDNEILHLKGFLRFREMENGVLLAKAAPSNNILPFLAMHFSDRFPNENFVMVDAGRNICVVHPAKKDWFLVRDAVLEEEQLETVSSMEAEYQKLFTYFCHKLAIEERKNLNLQRQMLPLHFRKYMSEFQS